MRWFGLPACTANPEGQTSITGTARLVLATFYIALTPLSGHTAEWRFTVTAHNLFKAITTGNLTQAALTALAS